MALDGRLDPKASRHSRTPPNGMAIGKILTGLAPKITQPAESTHALCRMCGGPDLVPAGMVAGYVFLECRTCDFVFAPSITAAHMDALYARAYHGPAEGAPEEGWANPSFLEPALRLLRQRRLRILDFGTGQSGVPKLLRARAPGHRGRFDATAPSPQGPTHGLARGARPAGRRVRPRLRIPSLRTLARTALYLRSAAVFDAAWRARADPHRYGDPPSAPGMASSAGGTLRPPTIVPSSAIAPSSTFSAATHHTSSSARTPRA